MKAIMGSHLTIAARLSSDWGPPLYLALPTEGNRRGAQNVCPVVWEEGRREDPSYPIAQRSRMAARFPTR